MPKCDFNKVAFRTPFRTPFTKSTSAWLLLNHRIVGFKSDLPFKENDGISTETAYCNARQTIQQNHIFTHIHDLARKPKVAIYRCSR